jgi:hypothetical protein
MVPLLKSWNSEKNKKRSNMWNLKHLIQFAEDHTANIPSGSDNWIPARPLTSHMVDRAKDAWEVFRGRADAVKWPGDQ